MENTEGFGARSHRASRLRASPSGGRGGRYIIIVYDTAIIIWEIRFPLQGYEGMHQKHSPYQTYRKSTSG